jgi:excinuclease Cho
MAVETEAPYTYPDHLVPELADLPSLPGVYVFHGETDGLPLYIGKSVNIRTRVMSHFRTTEEARLLNQTKRISHFPTAGEIGALLLESKMIKHDYPLFNKRLRRTRQLCSIRLQGELPEVVYARDIDFSFAGDLYGLFNSQRAALEHLMSMADENKLCYSRLGLERPTNGKPCFRSQVKLCAGACCGLESPSDHQERLRACLTDLQVSVWPYAGPIGLIERYQDEDGNEEGEAMDIHVVMNWCHLGTVNDMRSAQTLAKVDASFDADAYKILCKPILSGTVEMVAL